MKSNFGWVEIDTIRYEHDVVIHTDKSITKRSKKSSKKFKHVFGHTPLTGDELAFLETEEPSVVYIGTGQVDKLPFTVDALKILSGYTTFLRPTPTVIRMLETENRQFTAILHVSC
jgi:hypothetical protein